MKTVKEAEREWFEGSVQSAAALMELAVTHIDRRLVMTMQSGILN